MTKSGRGKSSWFFRMVTFACYVTICTLEAGAAPLPKTEVIRYLEEFGYLLPTSDGVISEETLSEAISEFQSFVGINVTGIVDLETTRWMQKPRCGNVDKIHEVNIPQALQKKYEDPEVCKHPRMDTIFYHSEDDAVYFFKGNHYWKLEQKGKIAAGYPKPIATKWKELPGDIDAAFSYYGKTYFIKGSQYWTYNGDDVDPDCPRSITDFPGVPAGIDTAWVRDDFANVHGYFIYIFRGRHLWIMRDPVHNPQLDPKFSEHLRIINGFPGSLDAAITYEGRTYFFKGDDYYLIEGMTELSVSQGYPKNTSIDWFGCS